MICESEGTPGFTPGESEMYEALREIDNLRPRPSDKFPADWHEQIAACSECQGWAKNHPIQRGICDTHRRPLWDREKHDAFEEQAIGPRAQIIARAALAKASPRHEEGE